MNVSLQDFALDSVFIDISKVKQTRRVIVVGNDIEALHTSIRALTLTKSTLKLIPYNEAN